MLLCRSSPPTACLTPDSPLLGPCFALCFARSRKVLEFGRTILGFLQSNCTTDNATYWLLRDASSDQVQLFDVSALLGKGQGGGGGDETQRTVAAPPAPGMVRSSTTGSVAVPPKDSAMLSSGAAWLWEERY